MSGRSNGSSHRSERSAGRGRDLIYEQDAWDQGRERYHAERRRREDAMYRGNAWEEYVHPRQRGSRTIRTFQSTLGSPPNSDDQAEYDFRDQRPRPPRVRTLTAGGAETRRFDIGSSDDDDIRTQARTPSWVSRDDRSVDTVQKKERDTLRRVVIGSTLEQSIAKLAENQTLLIQSLMQRNDNKPEYKQKLTSIIVEKWSGGKGATAKSYRAWKKLIQSVAIQYGLRDSETAFLIKINCIGFAKEAKIIQDQGS